MPSQKTIVVDHLWDVLSAERRTIATFQDVREAIKFCNDNHGNTLKTDNPANFMKDLLRGGNASRNWPDRLKDLKITGRQITGQDRIFEFVPYAEGQLEPFPNPFEPQGTEPELVIQSLSMPLATKSLGRTDESWLIQVAVQLKVLESHFAPSNRRQTQQNGNRQLVSCGDQRSCGQANSCPGDLRSQAAKGSNPRIASHRTNCVRVCEREES
jgi:hypothetical protein